jgi:DNA-binding MarR family transcriptional regulator
VDRIFQAKQDDNPNCELTQQIRHLQRAVNDLAELVTPSEVTSAPEVPVETRQFIRTILKLRANRRNIFGADVFGEPCWDMLLELYDADLRGRRESVSSLCIASGVPSTTALRWIKVLEREGCVRRIADPHDGRRYFMELTEVGKAALDRIFAALKFPDRQAGQ